MRSTGPAVECALIYNQDTRTFTLERQNVKLDMKKGTKEVAPMVCSVFFLVFFGGWVWNIFKYIFTAKVAV